MQGFSTAECVAGTTYMNVRGLVAWPGFESLAVLMFLVRTLQNNSKLQSLTVNSGNFEHWQLCEHLIIEKIGDSE